jgi:hypothetical protein
MKSLYQAYEAYERRVIRGEYRNVYKKPCKNILQHESIMERLGDFLICTGLRLKHRSLAGKPMAWTPMTGSKS